ncbi:MAG TPA: SBBP repeat-containing protein, partial [Fimbriimonas sp.]|nr:SBBP repeat-containing protein [Fimbriimonas sp.]
MTKTTMGRAVLGILTLSLGTAVFAQTGIPKPEAKSMLKSRPMSFVKNAGQWNSQALFGGHASGMDFWVSKSGFVFQYFKGDGDKVDPKIAGHTVGMLFEGAKPFVAKGEKAAGINRYVGKKISDATKYEKVRLAGVYDKIDAVAYFDGKAPRYDFIVHPGAAVSDINLKFKGTSKVDVVSPTKLAMQTSLGTKFQEGLFAYQTINGKKVSVPVSFKQIDATHVGFSVGAYDKSKDLVIDPLVYGTYYGGDRGWDEVRGVAADDEGNVYITGYTRSPIYPVLFGPFGFNLQGGDDAFVSRLQGDVYNHDYSVLVAGPGTDRGNFIRIDPTGNIWVLGSTSSTTIAGNSDPGNMWLMRFSPDPNTILTPFLGGNPVFFRFGGPTAAPDVDAMTSFSMRDDVQAGTVRMLLTGLCDTTNGATGLVTGANSGSFHGTIDYNETTGFSVVAGASGFALANTPAQTTITGGDFDANGNFFLTGTLLATGNSDTAQGATPVFDTTPGVFLNGRLQRQNDIWVRKYVPSGAITWSALVGGASSDVTEGIFHTSAANGFDIGGTTCATDPQGNIYILGRTASFDFPRTPGVFGEVFNGGQNYITVTKIRHDGAAIIYSTNIQNTGSINASGIGVDSMGNAYITGVAHAPVSLNNPPPDPIEPGILGTPGSIPLVNPIRPAYTFPALPEASSNDGWMMILNANASAIIRSTWVGGILDEGVFAPFVDPGGDVWVFGWVDTWRYYVVTSSSGTQTERIAGGRTGGLDPGFITNLAFKQNGETAGQGSRTISGYFFDTPFGEQGFNMRYHRDGFLLRFRESLPLLQNMTLAPSPIPGGDPQGLANHPSTTGTITLSGPAPAGGATVKLTLNNSTVASFLQNSSSSSLTVIVPAGSTTATYNVYSRVVTAPTPVQVRANYNGNIRTATFTVVPWLQAITLNGSSLIGGNSTTATVTLAANAPAGGVVVDLAASNPALVSFPGGATLTIPGGTNQATFAIDTNGVDAATTVQLSASLLGVTRTADLGITPARL